MRARDLEVLAYPTVLEALAGLALSAPGREAWLATRPLRAEIYDVLAANGVDTTMVDSARLATLVRRIGTNGNSIAIDSLVPGGVSPVPAPPGMSLRRQDARSTRSVKSESLYCRGAP